MDPRILAEFALGRRVLQAVLGDMTAEPVDAIVNAANSKLVHGGGLAGAIVARGGVVIQEESDRLAPVATGKAVATSAGALPCRWVIHAVGPVWGDGDEESLVAFGGAGEPRMRGGAGSNLDRPACNLDRYLRLPEEGGHRNHRR